MVVGYLEALNTAAVGVSSEMVRITASLALIARRGTLPTILRYKTRLFNCYCENWKDDRRFR